jgi:hypothetical protein
MRHQKQRHYQWRLFDKPLWISLRQKEEYHSLPIADKQYLCLQESQQTQPRRTKHLAMLL